MALQYTPDGTAFYVPDDIVAHTLPEYPTTTGIPTLPPPPPPTQHLADLPEYGTGGTSALPTVPSVPPTQKIGINPTLGADETPAPADTGPPSVTGGMLPPQVQQGVMNGFAPPTQTSPDTQVPAKQAAGIQAADAAANAAYTKQQAVQAKADAAAAAHAATPEGMQERAAADQMAAKEEEQRLAKQQGDEQAAQSAELERLKNEQIDAQNKLAVQQEKDRQARLAEEQTLFSDHQKAVQAAADLKVDPNRYWNEMSTGKHIQTGIGIALSGLGQGYLAAAGVNAPNMAMEMVKGAIDRDVDAQKANIGQANQTASAKGQLLSEDRANNEDADRSAAMQKAEGYERAAQQVEATALHYKGAAQQLAAQQMIQGLRGEKDKILAGLAQQQVAERHQAVEEHVAQQNANTASYHASIANRQELYAEKTDKRDFAEKQREYDTGLAEKILTAKNSGNATAVKQLEGVRKYGLRDPSTGALILDKQGEAKMARADALEVAARGKPQSQADALRAQAAAIRDDAERNDYLSHEKAPEQNEKLGYAQTALEQVADIRQKLKDDPGMTDRKAWASILANSELLKIDTIKSYGMNASSREMAAFEGVAGPNGEKVLDRDFSVGKMEAHLDAIEKALKSDSNAIYHSAGGNGSFHLEAHGGDAATTIGSDKTAVEAAAAATKGVVGRNLPDSDLKFRSNDARQRQVEESTPSGPTGLSPTDTAKVASLIARYHNATDTEQGKILTELTAFAQSDREAVSNGAVGLIRANPEVYHQVLSVLPPEKKAQWETFDSAATQPGGVTIPDRTPKPSTPFVPKGGIPR